MSMSKDPAFLFYPGDYLRDTQCLSEAVQVAYDRIMCEHMRNICITQAQLKFFTKKLTTEEKEELLMVLTKVDGGFQIDWVVASISKRRAYSESRRQNRSSKPKNISTTYDAHMENAIENENEIVIDTKTEKNKKPDELEVSNYFLELGLDDFTAQAQAKLYINHYTSNGWKVGKNNMKDWKAAARGWKERMTDYKKNINGTHKQTSNGNSGTSASRVEALRKW